ncbi:uncharacterized protein LOC123876502 isoform X2 [Maniola jurtina]|uniref:uncharacterized protein LOC123876502 isoform X2 n=1 Tax=Maniola jurtina TaxID=191418 RepID=UPI001E68CC70|nr:uncharacterized protein LOC123876502 isoform X2 [Maniola jurtina]
MSIGHIPFGKLKCAALKTDGRNWRGNGWTREWARKMLVKVWSEEEIEQFIKDTMRSLRGQSTYYNDYCAHLSPEFKTRPFKPREKKRRPCKPEDVVVEETTLPPAPKLAIKDTELMKVARELYERDMDKPTLEPLPTHPRILGYVRPSLYKTGISEYQQSVARLAYEMIRDDRLPRYYAHNGCRPRWALPPEGVRQPELDVAPYDGERLY